MRERLLEIYERLFAAYGKQHWWPAETPFEVAVGAVLTQNTAWTNVEKAISNLRNAGLLDFPSLSQANDDTIAELIRPSGFYRLKTCRLRALFEWWHDEVKDRGDHASLRRKHSDDEHRAALLAVPGIGGETADAILLYAFGIPTFVVDAYTKRMMHRHFGTPENIGYEPLRALFMDNLPHDAALFNEYHALIVQNAKAGCIKRACLDTCALHKLPSIL